MGFFDAMKKIIGDAQQLKSQLDSMSDTSAAKTQHPAQKPIRPAAAPDTAARKTDAALLETGHVPAKPSVRRNDYGYRDDKDYDISFLLSGDFIEFNSHCEDDPAFLYEPQNNEEYTCYQDNHPYICFSANDAVYYAIEAYHKTGTGGNDFTKIENGTFLFKARTEHFGNVLWMYAFSAQSAREGEAICLEYAPDIVGTPLEQKLIAALDEAAMTYTETKSNG